MTQIQGDADRSGQRRVLVAIASYNERDTLPTLVDAIENHLPGADLLVVDDNSPDGTGDWCDQRAACDPRFTCLHRAGKLGLGSASYAAFGCAIERGYDIVATLDADWSHPPDQLPALIEAIREGEVAIGSRYCPGGEIEGWPWRRRVASWLLNAVARRALRLPIADCSGAFRAYRVETLQMIDFSATFTSGYAYLEELLWRLKCQGVTFVERPITFSERRAGASKINAREAFEALRVLCLLGAREWLGLRRS